MFDVRKRRCTESNKRLELFIVCSEALRFRVYSALHFKRDYLPPVLHEKIGLGSILIIRIISCCLILLSLEFRV